MFDMWIIWHLKRCEAGVKIFHFKLIINCKLQISLLYETACELSILIFFSNNFRILEEK